MWLEIILNLYIKPTKIEARRSSFYTSSIVVMNFKKVNLSKNIDLVFKFFVYFSKGPWLDLSVRTPVNLPYKREMLYIPKIIKNKTKQTYLILIWVKVM